MFAAEIHGKMSPINPPRERSEDLLTSHLFSIFRYINNHNILSQFIGRARNINNKSISVQKINSINVIFWPKYELNQSGKREADVMLLLNDGKEEYLSLVIEAKLDSGLSNIDIIGDHEDEKNENTIKYGHQLADEFCGVKCGRWYVNETIQQKLNRSADKLLVYITNHYEIPRVDLEETYEALLKHRNCSGCSFDSKEDIYWLSWRDMTGILKDLSDRYFAGYSNGERNLLSDLLNALLIRDLGVFDPFLNFCEVDLYESHFMHFQNLIEIDVYQTFLNS